MRLRLTVTVLVDSRPLTRELEVDAAPGTSCRELATAMASHLATGAAPVHLSVSGAGLPPEALVGRPPLVDGAAVTLAPGLPTAARHLSARRRTPVTLTVTHGPDAGRSIELPPGRLTLGRSPDADVQIDDPHLSRLHAEVTIAAEGLRVRDLNSTNGTRVADTAADRPLALTAGQVLALGDTRLVLRMATGIPAASTAQADGTRTVNRRPRIRAVPEPPVFTLPTAPEPPRRNRVPWPAMVLPVPVAAVMALFLGPTMLVFAFMGPVLMGGTYLSDRLGGRRSYAAELAEHERLLARLQASVDSACAEEARERRAGLPDAATLLTIASAPTARLWERRSGDDDAMTVSLGTCTTRARVRVAGAGLEDNQQHPPLADVPCAVPLAEVGVLGVCGPRDEVLGAARHVVGQLVTLHSPLDLSVIALAGRGAGNDWQWLTRLPHSRRPDGEPLPHGSAALALDEHATRAAVLHWARTVTERLTTPGSGAARWRGPWTLLVLDGAAALRGLPGLATVLEHGPRVGLLTLAVDTDDASLPTETGALLDLSRPAYPALRLPGSVHEDLAVDRVGPWWADRLSRGLAPLRDATPVATEASLPRDVPLPEVAPHSGDANAIAALWRERPTSTAVPVGAGRDAAWVLDLAADGPHILVGGTTGSGKSEFLRALVTSLALHNRPEHLSFVLVDYKGGAAFRECARLPHTAGVVTDLDDHLAQRALTSLTAELKRRERLFRSAGVSDLASYQRVSPAGEVLPRLVIVIDEFRALADELPAFVDGMVRIAALGRSLGVHLVLATQRPAGVVSADIKANVNLRVALRVRDRADSDDVIEAPDAALVDAATPGRGYYRVGGGPLNAFQAAHVGAPAAVDRPGGIRVRELSWGRAPAPWPGRAGEDSQAGPGDGVVDAVVRAAGLVGARPGRRAWLPALPESVALATLSRTDDGLACPIGLADHPDEQAQHVLSVDLHASGHWGFVGTAASGRTTALSNLAASAAHQLDPTQLHVYAVSGGSLCGLAALPHCGAHVALDDLARVERLVDRLAAELARRRRQPGGADPRILLLVDDWDLVAGRHESLEHSALAERILGLLREGAGLGLTAALAGDRALLVGRVASVITHRVLLRLAEPADAALVGLRGAALPTDPAPGRGVLTDGTEVQLALAGTVRARAVGASTGPLPMRVEPLPTRVSALDLASRPGRHVEPGMVLMGLGGDDLQPVGLSPAVDGRRWLVAGPSASGVSNALANTAQQLLDSGHRVAVVSDRPGPLDLVRADRRLLAWCTAGDAAELAAARRAHPDLAVVVDSADELTDAPVDPVLREIARLVDRDTGLVVVGANCAVLVTQFRGVAVEVARHRVGLLLRPDSVSDTGLFGLRIRPDRGAPVGRGHLVRRAGAVPVQTAVADAPPPRDADHDDRGA